MTTLTPADLAEELRVSEANVLRWRREKGWPSLKVGNKIRFTPEHVAEIKAALEVRAEVRAEPETPVISGQTARSASSRRAS